MRIEREGSPATPQPVAAPSQTRPNALLQAGLLVLAFALGFAIARTEIYRPLTDLVTIFLQRPAFVATTMLSRSDLPTLTVDLDFAAYQRLLDAREQALLLGANVVGAGDAVPATLRTADGAVAIDVRLPQGPADALIGETWPFEVAVQAPETLFDLRRFTLTPVEETVLSTWGYVAALRRAGLLAPRLQLVRLVVNGTDRGLTLLEESPAAEMLAAAERPAGVLVAFDSSAYWEAAAHLGGALSGSGFQYARVVSLPTGTCAAEEPEIQAACDEAASLLQALQAGTVAPSQALDVEKTAAFLALTALWRGSPELDWRTLTFAYDPATARLEPVGRGAALAPVAPLPDALLDDPHLQVALARALEALGQPAALASLQDDLQPDLESLRLALGPGAGTLEMPWPALEAHQATMRRQVAPAVALLAALEPGEDGLVVRVGNLMPFPVEVVALDVGENAFLSADPAWVDGAERELLVEGAEGVVLRAATDSGVRTVRLRVPPEALGPMSQPAGEVGVAARLWGLEGQHVVVATLPADEGAR